MIRGWTVFSTTIGTCGIAWDEAGFVGLRLPAGSIRSTKTRLARLRPGLTEVTPPWPDAVDRAIQGIRALFEGEHIDLTAARLDYTGVPEFDRRVYEIARTIPPGRTLTYGDIAKRLGDPALSRAVGQALGRNPFPIVVPCHRVIAAGREIGGFSAPGGISTKRRLLAIEAGQDRLPL